MAENNAAVNTTPAPVKLKKLYRFEVEGKVFDTQKEAGEYLRRHLVVDALTKVVAGTPVTVQWLMDNQKAILAAYDASKPAPRTISEETKKKMAAARNMSPEQRAAAKAAAEKAKAAAKAAKEAAAKK